MCKGGASEGEWIHTNWQSATDVAGLAELLNQLKLLLVNSVWLLLRQSLNVFGAANQRTRFTHTNNQHSRDYYPPLKKKWVTKVIGLAPNKAR